MSPTRPRSARSSPRPVSGTDYPLPSTSAVGTSGSRPPSIPIAPGAGPVPVDAQVGGDDREAGRQHLQDGQRQQVHGHVRHGPARLQRQRVPLRPDQARPDLGERPVLGQLVRALQLASTRVHPQPGGKIGVQGSLADASSVNDPIVSLRVTGGSQNQSLDCDPNLRTSRTSSPRAAAPPTRRTPGTACPGTASVLWATASPGHAPRSRPAGATNQVSAGLNQRILGDDKPNTCTAPESLELVPGPPSGRPADRPGLPHSLRVVQRQRQHDGPRYRLRDLLRDRLDQPGRADSRTRARGTVTTRFPATTPGYIVGHFIKYIETLNNGNGGTQPCDLNSFGACVAVLTE